MKVRMLGILAGALLALSPSGAAEQPRAVVSQGHAGTKARLQTELSAVFASFEGCPSS